MALAGDGIDPHGNQSAGAELVFDLGVHRGEDTG